MGVPGFFAWILKKYRTTNIIQNKLVTDKKKVFYLDKNCLIHPECFEVLKFMIDTKDVKKLEKTMHARVINYLDFLIKQVDPDEVYLAVDGVAPMAKMNQQRKRRFTSGDDRDLRNNILKKHGRKITDIWNNTCITPGTVFMETLHKEILKYIKTNTKIKISYSSYHTPGEGEHKILQDIKERKDEDNVNIIYGLDADLIFLALASQKENIYLLREKSQFDNTSKKIVINDVVKDVYRDLSYVDIDELKKYINDQMNSRTSGENIDLSNDFIFICYLLGNDFLPHLPSIDIKTGGLDLLINCYVEIYNDLMSSNKQTTIIEYDDGKVKINNVFLSLLLNSVANYEKHYFTTIYPKHKERVSKRKPYSSDPCDIELWNLDNMRDMKINDPIKLGVTGEKDWKFRYYEYYFNISDYQDKHIVRMSNEYFRGLLWVTKYYFEYCPDWQWQYPYSHAPFLSDVALVYNNKNIDINSYKFINSTPSNPFTQLLAVLPPRCKDLLPVSYRSLVSSEESPIIDMYPIKVELDMINKDNYFKCIPYIPIVDIDRINMSIENLPLTNIEIIRNKSCDIYKNSFI